MIKFRNCSSNIHTHIRVIKALFKFFDNKIFDLEDIAWAITESNLMTSYGYSGAKARSLSDVSKESENSTKMNSKLYAEVFRTLGLMSSFEADKAYPLVFTELGKYIATSPKPIDLYKECVMGISTPQEIMSNIKYDEEVRFGLTTLKSFVYLDDVMYKHEICFGPMSVNDTKKADFICMINKIKNLRGNYSNYLVYRDKFCKSVGMKCSSVDNQTRFPLGVLVGVGWIKKEKSATLYPPKSLFVHRITDEGKLTYGKFKDFYDLRLPDYKKYSLNVKEALVRVGHYSMLKRAGYDFAPVCKQFNDDLSTIQPITQGKELLFSPYQVLNVHEVNKALDINTSKYCRFSISGSGQNAASVPQRKYNTRLKLEPKYKYKSTNSLASIAVVDSIKKMSKKNMSRDKITNKLFESAANTNKDYFYPMVRDLFIALGYECVLSRDGDNGSRWDAIIIGPGNAIPIEIKSPGEEEFISLKGVKQALENKIILLSRNPYRTNSCTPTLVVGYRMPNNRSEVESLIDSIHATFFLNVAVISFYVLCSFAVDCVLDEKSIVASELENIRGFIDVKT